MVVAGINRRTFLGWAAAMPALLHGRLLPADQTDLAARRFASASKADDGLFYLVLFDGLGQVVCRHPLPGRAHQIVRWPARPWVLVVSRRPGTTADIVNYQTQALVRRIECSPGYHLYGHAQVTADGRYLFTTEKSPSHENGRMVIRDAGHDCKIVREYSTAGIGPHELRLSADQRTMLVANGGIKTEGRKKVNLDTMRPSLAYIDIRNGELLEQLFLPDEYHQSSIRHLDISANGQAIIAMQYQGNPGDSVPLVALHRRDEAMQPLTIPTAINGRLRQYCGSVCFDSTGDFVAVSAPRGNMILLWDIRKRRFQGAIKVRDGCGVAKTGEAGEFLVSSGAGSLYLLNSLDMTRTPIPAEFPVSWDNHLSRIS
ncbi:MAG: hypothetical protein CSA52_00870 [Gammaproteobacteria bacterium]|nr:MAG: hypothetical protein CSB48_08185 [Pseudomonadota bacterium]PIE38851.1 MAG: hypothetical protein CSA52_00870 [Gammaproteobacteria bacterium]